MFESFLDLTHYEASRADLRRLEKQLKGIAGYLYKQGRVFHFRFRTELDRLQFIASITRALTMTGYRYKVTSQPD